MGNSVWKGAFVQDESTAGAGGDGYADLTIDGISKWIVTGNSTLLVLVCMGSIEDEDGKAVTMIDSTGMFWRKGKAHIPL